MNKITLFLVGTTMLMLLPMKSWGQKAYTWLSDDGKTFTFCYDDLKSSREGSTYSLSEEWYNDTKKVTTVVFNPEFANFRPTSTSSWFREMSLITEIPTLGYLNTTNVKDMSYMFAYCSKLNSLNLSNFNTKKVTDMSSMFSSCRGLTSLDLSKFNTAVVTNMKEMFSGCIKLASLNLSSFDTKSVTNMEYMFSSCTQFTSLDLSKFNTESVTDMGYMFSGCNNLTSLNLSNFNTAAVTTMCCMFENCIGLTSLDLSKFNTESVKDMIMMFSGCKNLTNLNLSSFNTKSLKTTCSMFLDCIALTSLDLSSFTTESVMNMSRMFENCSKLTSLDISNFNTSNVTDMYNMFYNCKSLTNLDVSNFNTESVENVQNMFWSCSSLTYLDVRGFDMSKVNATNSVSMLYGCKNLKTLKISTKMSGVADSACELVGTSSSPCTLFAPNSFDFGNGVDTSGNYFRWNKGYFKLKNENITISSYGVSTYCYDLDLDLNDVTDFKAYVVSGYNQNTGNVTLMRVYNVPAGTGIIVKGKAGTYDIPVGVSESLFTNMLVGTTNTSNIQPTDGDKTNLVLSSKNGIIGFYTFASTLEVEANKAYLQLPTSALSANGMGLEFEDETTGIDGVEEVDMTDVVWYTIEGRKLDAMPTQKGMYIANGRKVVVK